METLTQIIELITKLLEVISWPLIVIIVFWTLREPLINFINNIKKIEYGKANIETTNLTKQVDDEEKKSPIELLSKGESNKDIDKAISLFSSETMSYFESAVKEETKLDSFTTPQEKLDILLKYSQIIYLIMHFNKIHNTIFGSQLKLLHHVNSSFDESKDTLKVFYDNAKVNNPNAYEDYSYGAWLSFLSNFGLIITESDNTIKITILGRDYLKYIIDTGLSIDKGL